MYHNNSNNLEATFVKLSDKIQYFITEFIVVWQQFAESYCFVTGGEKSEKIVSLLIIIIIYHDFLPTPRRGSHVKLGKTHTQSSRYTPWPIYLTAES